MHDPDQTKAYKPEQSSAPDKTVGDVGSQPEHPSEDVLLQLATGRLDETQAENTQTHLTACAECTTIINQLRGSIDSFVDGLGSTDSPQRDLTAAASPPDETVDDPAPTVEKASESTTPSFGDYDLISEIARGGMGVVYKAWQNSLNRTVALKMIKSGEFANQEQVDRFYKEAEAAANLDHPGIVPVFEVGEVDGQHYFTMGFVDGDTLADRLRDGPLPPKEAARFAKSIAEAVAYAHSKGVIHRDLKPGNVLITKDGVLRITDFGLAKRIEEDSELTSTGQVLGTPSYMPPEQAEGKLADTGPAADVYAIGATLYCMLVGRPPFQAANLIETLQQVMHTEPVSLKMQNPAVPADLETLCLKCLEKKPGNRYATSQVLVYELNRFLSGEPITARQIGRFERTLRWCKRKPTAAAAVFAFALIPVITSSLLLRQTILSRQAAIARVDTLLNASPATIPIVLGELDRTAGTVRTRLRELDSQDLLPQQRVRVSLALLPYDNAQVVKLKEQLYDCTYDEFAVIVSRLKLYGGEQLAPDLWTTLHNPQSSTNDKFRVAIALATLDPESEQWTSDEYEFLIDSLLAENTLHQPAIRRALLPIADKLVGTLQAAFLKAEESLVRESSANTALDFAANNLELLAELSSSATPKQHSILFPRVVASSGSDQSVVEKLIDLTKLKPREHDDEATRVALGKKRAGAAINLLLLDRPSSSLEALRIKDDPESLTQFIHGCRDRGVTVVQLLELLNLATSEPEKYGILLALSEFEVVEIPTGIRSDWVNLVRNLYATDPSSGIHGASGWLLRRWGLTDQAKRIDEREIPYSKDRQWFTLKIELVDPPGVETYSYFTFVVFQAGDYQIGSPKYEANRESSNEKRRGVTISRPFAVLDREVTRREFQLVTGFRGFYNEAPWMSEPDSAMAAANWYDSVEFCRHLTLRRGLSEEEQSYEDPQSYEGRRTGFANQVTHNPPVDWGMDLDSAGFRLPTAAEWEIACRGGKVSRFSFGCDETHLRRYGWYAETSGSKGHNPRVLAPNARGLFDMHGNMVEWCHDWSGGNTLDVLTDPTGAEEGSFRVHSGGGWFSTMTYCRSARRGYSPPTNPNFTDGFRVALSLGSLPPP